MIWRWKIAQWFELRWWKKYLADKSKGEYLEWKKNYWLHLLSLISESIKLEPSKTIADMGCGPAGVFIALPQNKITAVDPLLDEYEKQVSFFKKADYPNVTFIQSTIEKFEINSTSASGGHPSAHSEEFDVVFCLNAINHVNDIEKGIEKLKEICADNGSIIVTIDTHNYGFFKYLFRLVPGDVLHPHQYSLKGYKKLLAKNGWKVSVPYLLKQEFFFNHYLLVAKREY